MVCLRLNIGSKAVDVQVWLVTQQLVYEGGKVRKFQDRPPPPSQGFVPVLSPSWSSDWDVAFLMIHR